MSSRYERVNTQDDDPDSPDATTLRQPQRAPNSTPPSFHSRTSSLERRRQGVDPALADAFDTDGDDSDDEPDDRQRLMRGTPSIIPSNTTTSVQGAGGGENRPGVPGRQTTQWPTPAASTSPQPTANANANARTYGGGIQSDGVFSNMTARPERGEKIVEEAPPTYEQAAADAAPPYWETTILAPGLGGPDDVYIDGMPVGSIFSFIWNGMISMSFQLVGFLLTYLLHSTHAAKNGSRAGLGITLIQYGFYMKGSAGSDGMSGSPADGYAQPPDPNSHDFDPNTVGTDNGEGGGSTLSDIASSEWVAYILMIVGWFILIRAVSDYIKARRHEQLVLQSPDRGLGVPIIAEGESAETVQEAKSDHANTNKVPPNPSSRLAALRAHLRPAPKPRTDLNASTPSRTITTMSWRSSGSSNAELVENLWRNKLITQPVVKDAFLRVDRGHYAPGAPYKDSPQSIGHAATISAPHMHASAVEALLPFLLPHQVGTTESESAPTATTTTAMIVGPKGRPRRVLDIGSGSGYLTHVLAELVGETGVVVGVEHIGALKELGEANMAKSAEGRALLESGRVRFRVGDGRRGWEEPSPVDAQPGVGGSADAEVPNKDVEGGWDAIHVGAAAVELHEDLVRQLRSPGLMFIPVNDEDGWDQYIWTVDKDENGRVGKKKLYGVRYVPLTDAPK
ncbi:Uu.00g135370.m01.CDS01 [Anthostomella pinea]|uniref:Uu.00g135370.m01.CDS01 n=1 Tax=Anthostomella pinea TaxID=933095 RepID=A0AAI8VP57_9PEZI|nr:Uu.00g135370.m01.CDS01 [Anthostomella pinea]